MAYVFTASPTLFLLLSVTLWGQGGSAAAPTSESDSSDAKACAALAQAAQQPWSVNLAEFVQPPFTTSLAGRPTKVTVPVPFCRVIGTVKPTPQSDITFELWLPPRAAWNGKFEGVGSGGSQGIIEYLRLMRALVRGYATVATDNGHRSVDNGQLKIAYDVTWALGQAERVIDFGGRAQHVVTQAAKALTERFYGRGPRYSYFVGCSQGGHHGLMEAQRFPEDYDGILAGDPPYNWTDEAAFQGWNVRALQATPNGALPVPKLQLLYQAVVKACAGVDGLIEDPRRCTFDPAILRCTATADKNSCLADSEVEAVHQMYAGPKTSTGVQIYPGLTRGSETGWENLWSDPKNLGGSWLGVYRFMVFENPAWNLSMMDFDHDPAMAKAKLGKILDPDNPDLSRFAARGGKLIIYHGWEDDMVPAPVATNYYAAVTAKMGNRRVNDFYRLFMIPGMWHCGGGPGATVLFSSEAAAAVPLDPDRDLLTSLEQWVERDRVPDSFTASRLTKDGSIERTRLICAYPILAKYGGTGDVNRAENWSCSTK